MDFSRLARTLIKTEVEDQQKDWSRRDDRSLSIQQWWQYLDSSCCCYYSPSYSETQDKRCMHFAVLDIGSPRPFTSHFSFLQSISSHPISSHLLLSHLVQSTSTSTSTWLHRLWIYSTATTQVHNCCECYTHNDDGDGDTAILWLKKYSRWSILYN